MESLPSCNQNYIFNPETQSCEHFLFPLSPHIIIGFFLTFLVAGFSSLTGVAGGNPHLVVLLLFYNYTPKHSTIAIFSCLLGTTLGNVFSQMRQKINDEPIIQYQYAFISIPILFMGSIVGLLINKLFPSIFICGFIMYWSCVSCSSIYKKFITAYNKETQENQRQNADTSQKYVQTPFNPLSNPRYCYVFKNLGCLFAIFIGLSLIKGTQKLDSVVGIESCSVMYWVLYLILFLVMVLFSYHNLGVLKQWKFEPVPLSEEIKSNENMMAEQNINYVVKMSGMAGLFTGLGLGGGMFLVPMYRQLGCNSIQAAATCSFTVFLSSLLNVIQGVLLGLIGFQDFSVLFVLAILGSFAFSSTIPKYLQKINRISLVEAVLLVLIILALINLPITLYLKYINSGYDLNLLFGFGKLC